MTLNLRIIVIDDTTANLTLKITDFDLATIHTDPRVSCSRPCGTLPFIAPEVLLAHEYDGLATDMWSEGIVLLEIQCGIRVMSKIFDMPNSQIGAINLSNRENRLVVGNMIKSRFTANSAGNMLEEHC